MTLPQLLKEFRVRDATHVFVTELPGSTGFAGRTDGSMGGILKSLTQDEAMLLVQNGAKTDVASLSA